MLDPKKLRKETSEVALNLSRRGFNFDQNTWNGKTTIQLKIKDVK